MIATQTGASCHHGAQTYRDIGLHLRQNRAGALAALTMVIALCGCSNLGLDNDQPWFRKPMYLFGQTGGYSFSDLQEKKQDRPVGANELVEANGSCPPPPVLAQASPVPSNQAASPSAAPMAAPDSVSLLGEGIALGMSECDVVYRAGAPANVELGKNPNGDRTVVLTYDSGPRPGIYRFERGRLMEMDRVAEPPPSPPVEKKKPAKGKKPPGNNAA
jgi:hypothetical protein